MAPSALLPSLWPLTLQALQKAISTYEQLAASPDTDHIESADKEKATAALSEAKAWMEAECAKQDALPKHAEPTLLTSAIDAKLASVKAACAVLNKPKPKPKPAEVKPTAEAEMAPAAEGAAAAPAAAPAAADGMDID